MGVPDPLRGADPLVRERRRHPDIDDSEVRLVLGYSAAQPLTVLDRRRHLVAGILEQAPETLAQQHLVLGDHDAHGSSTLTVVPAPGRLSIASRPPSAATRSVRPASPEPSA